MDVTRIIYILSQCPWCAVLSFYTKHCPRCRIIQPCTAHMQYVCIHPSRLLLNDTVCEWITIRQTQKHGDCIWHMCTICHGRCIMYIHVITNYFINTCISRGYNVCIHMNCRSRIHTVYIYIYRFRFRGIYRF